MDFDIFFKIKIFINTYQCLQHVIFMSFRDICVDVCVFSQGILILAVAIFLAGYGCLPLTVYARLSTGESRACACAQVNRWGWGCWYMTSTGTRRKVQLWPKS